MNVAAQPAQTSGSSTWTTVTPRFSVAYSSYIPVDHVYGADPCEYVIPGTQQSLPITKLYRGDAFRGTYRTTQSIFTVVDKSFYDTFLPNAGPTRNYGYGSPANGQGSNLSSSLASSDIYNGPYTGADEDNVQFDCVTWNDRGKADLSNMQGHSVTFFPGSNQAQVNLNGLGQDPLEPQIGGVKWNAIVTLNDANPSQPTAQVTITYTCYPAHIVKVNGQKVFEYIPTINNTAYVAACLLMLPQPTQTTGAVPVPTH